MVPPPRSEPGQLLQKVLKFIIIIENLNVERIIIVLILIDMKHIQFLR